MCTHTSYGYTHATLPFILVCVCVGVGVGEGGVHATLPVVMVCVCETEYYFKYFFTQKVQKIIRYKYYVRIIIYTELIFTFEFFQSQHTHLAD